MAFSINLTLNPMRTPEKKQTPDTLLPCSSSCWATTGQQRTPNIGPLEKPDPKYRPSVKQKTDPIFRRLTIHNKYIDAGKNVLARV